MISCRLASILVEFAREVKEAHMIILAEKATKKVSFVQTKKTHKYIERGTNTQNANIDTLKYTNTHKYTNKQKVEATGDLKSEIPATKTQ